MVGGVSKFKICIVPRSFVSEDAFTVVRRFRVSPGKRVCFMLQSFTKTNGDSSQFFIFDLKLLSSAVFPNGFFSISKM